MTGSPKRIGVTFPGDLEHPATWSGVTSGLMRGLREIGVEPVAIRVEPRSGLLRFLSLNVVAAAYLRPGRDLRAVIRRARYAAQATPVLGRVHTYAARTALRHTGHLDGIIQLGTGYQLATDVPVVTYEDMTVSQITTCPYPGWDLLSPRAFNRRLAVPRQSYAYAVGVCAFTSWGAKSLIEDYGVAPDKVHVVGVGNNHNPPPVEGRDWSEPRFLFVGTDWQRKNGDGLLRAFARLRQEIPTARLDVVGNHPPLNQPGVTGHGFLRMDDAEQRRSLESLFATATCFVMPSHSDTGNIVYATAATAGLPCIGTRTSLLDFLIDAGGVVIEPGDDDVLVAAMREMADPDVAARTGASARRASDDLTWAAVAQRVVDVFEAPVEASPERQRQ